MTNKIYGKYFQKSRVFLYPLLGFKKEEVIKPESTHIAWPTKIIPKDVKFILVYNPEEHKDFIAFEQKRLIAHPLFEAFWNTDTGKIAYIFNMTSFRNDYVHFYNGRYSKLSEATKRVIMAFFKANSSNRGYVETYLYPEKYFDLYSRLLGVSEEHLKKTGQLCDPPDLNKESFQEISVGFEIKRKIA